MNAEHGRGGPPPWKTAPSPHADPTIPPQADPGIRALAAYLRQRRAMRQAARHAAGLTLFLEVAHRRAEAVAAAHIADALRQALR